MDMSGFEFTTHCYVWSIFRAQNRLGWVRVVHGDMPGNGQASGKLGGRGPGNMEKELAQMLVGTCSAGATESPLQARAWI